MSRPNFIVEALARRHVEKHEDYLVQGFVQTLYDDLECAIKERDALAPVGFTDGGRWALRHMIVGLLMVATLLGAYRLSTSAGSRQGIADGQADAHKWEDRVMARVLPH